MGQIDLPIVNAIKSVVNSDGSLTISPTTGNVIASLNVGNANTWTATQTFGTTTEINWRDSQIRAVSTADGTLLIEADTALNINTTDGDTNIGNAGNTRIGSAVSFALFDSAGDLTLPGELKHEGSQLSFFNTALASQTAAYTPTNVSADRSYDANATTLDELADVVGTIIADLQLYGLLA